MGEAVVPATDQVTVRAPDQVTAVLGEVTWKGPALPTTFTNMSSVVTPPPPARLSRAVTRNSARDTAGNSSPKSYGVIGMSKSFGNVLELLVEGGKERKSGLLPLSAAERACAGPRSRSSQQ